MKRAAIGAVSVLGLLVSACGGGSGGTPPPPPPPPIGINPPTVSCSLRDRQEWVGVQMREWYLFPDLLPTNLDPAGFSTVQAYINELTAAARAQRKDRFFTHITSIAEENAFFESGQTAGFGIRLSTDVAARRVFVVEAFEGAPALAAGVDRGTEILAIGTSETDLRTVSDIIAAEGAGGVSAALGPSTAGTTRVLRITDAGGTRNVTITKADFEIPPVSPRYGARVIDHGGRKVGYLNLRTFISSADPALRTAFADFRAQGISEVVVDFRYNGGGLVSIAELMGDLFGRNRSPSDVFSFTTFRSSKSLNDDVRHFQAQAESIAPMKLAFIGTGGTASASELVINAFIPYLRANAALIGTNTFGKPVGQIALDRAACDDRLRVVAFAIQNAERQGDYFDGLAGKVEASCQAADDITRQFGDPEEASVRQALNFLDGGSCTAIGTAATAQAVRPGVRRDLIVPEQPTTAQREIPGFF